MPDNHGRGIPLGTQFSPRYRRFLDDRMQFDNLAQLKSFSESSLITGMVSYVTSENAYYKYTSNNLTDPITGKWRKFLDGDGLPNVDGNSLEIELDKKLSTTGWTSNEFNKVLSVDNKGNVEWVARVVGEGGGSGTLESAINSNITVGGSAAGTKYPEGSSVENVLKNMLVKYYPPSISISLSPSTTIYEIGTTTPPITITVNAVKNSDPIEYLRFFIQSNTVYIMDKKTYAEIVDGGTFTYTYNDPINETTTVSVKCSDGETVVSDSKVIKFIHAMYADVSNDIELQPQVSGKILREKGTITNTYTANNQYVNFWYPTSYGKLNSIMDQNNFENINSFTYTIVMVNGVNYYYYRSITPVTCSSFKYTFKW